MKFMNVLTVLCIILDDQTYRCQCATCLKDKALRTTIKQNKFNVSNLNNIIQI